MTGIGDKSDIIQYIAKNLDFYIQNFQSDLIEVPITILKNMSMSKEKLIRKVHMKLYLSALIYQNTFYLNVLTQQN